MLFDFSNNSCVLSTIDLLMTYRASTQPSVASLLFVRTLYHSLVRVGVLTWACSSISRRSPRFTSARSNAASAVDERIFSFGAFTIPSSILESDGSKLQAVIRTEESATSRPATSLRTMIDFDNTDDFRM